MLSGPIVLQTVGKGLIFELIWVDTVGGPPSHVDCQKDESST